MKYTININQKGLSNDPEVGIIEASVMDWIFTICGTSSDKVDKSRLNGYTWINLTHLLKDMPILRIKTKSGAGKLVWRIKRLGYIDIRKSTDGQKLYVLPTQKMMDLYLETVSLETHPVSPETHNRILEDTDRIPQDTNHNTNIIILDHNTNITSSGCKPDQEDVNDLALVEHNIGKLPEKYGKTPILRLASMYQEIWRSKYGSENKKLELPRFGKTMKKLLESNTETQITALLFTYLFWYGIDDNNDKEYSYLENIGFPVEFIIKKYDDLVSYLTHSARIVYNDPNEINRYLVIMAKKILKW